MLRKCLALAVFRLCYSAFFHLTKPLYFLYKKAKKEKKKTVEFNW